MSTLTEAVSDQYLHYRNNSVFKFVAEKVGDKVWNSCAFSRRESVKPIIRACKETISFSLLININAYANDYFYH
ncbi:MAG: hypothetical protein ACK5DE_02985 [Bacteroidota bacterium]|jgi:hypothetical protein